MRIIKKYANRRLYDTHLSTYITLESLRELVIRHEPFQVIDDKTQNDLTVPTLFQVIVELESEAQPFFTRLLLEQMIRIYGHPLQPLMVQYLEQWLPFMMNQSSPPSSSFDPLRYPQQWMQGWQQWFNPNVVPPSKPQTEPLTESEVL